MAHLRMIEDRCIACKRRRASFELFNRVNAPCGKYCHVCAKRALAEQKKIETGEGNTVNDSGPINAKAEPAPRGRNGSAH